MKQEQVAVLTWGCTHNQKDSQLMEQQLLNGGYQLISEANVDHADVVVLNTCTVKTPTEDKILHVLDKIQEAGQKTVITGCLSQADPEFLRDRYPTAILLGVNASTKILAALNPINASDTLVPLLNSMDIKRNIRDNNRDWTEKPALESTQWNKNLNIIQINEGCLNFCTFCATKKARGHLRSFQAESIIQSIRNLPTPEVWLTSQDTACWGFDFNQTLSDLILEIDKIQRKFWVRVGMGNPNNFIKFLDEAVEAFKSEKIYKFLHLPVQAGNNAVLRHMRRGYSVEEYEKIVEKFRKEIPGITLSTDVICGYPTETEADFKDTIRTITKTRPSITNISRYWERRDTIAAGLEQLPFKTRKQRSQDLTAICNSMQQQDNQEWIGWEGELYLAEMGSKGGIQGRNIYYKPVIVDLPETELGKWVDVRIVEARTTYFIGEILN